MFLENILFPKHCLSCGKIGNVLCDACKSKITKVRTQSCIYCFKPSLAGFTHHSCRRRFGVDELVSVYRYDGVVRRVLKKVKYKLTRKSFLWFLNEIFIDIQTGFNQALKIHKNITLCPIPLHPTRQRQRGFNQVEIIAKFLSLKFKIPISNLLVRVKNTKPQSDLQTHQERKNNIKNSFKLIKKDINLGKTVMLVDDIVTSGHTVREAAYILKRNKIKKVIVFSLARAF